MEKDLFRTRDHVADFEEYLAAYTALSDKARSELPAVIDVAYGESPDETLDLFLPEGAGRSRPVHLFVHGGYWRMFSKRDFSFVARAATAAGAVTAVMDYSLMPAVRMTTIVDQVRRAAHWLRLNARSYGGDPDQLTVSGHSAGAHLCTFLLDTEQGAGIRGAFLLSGIYDLRPLQASFLAPLIAISDEEVRSFSPLTRQHAAGGPVKILHGDQETEPFHSQAAAFNARLLDQGVDASDRTLVNTNHMSAVLQLNDPTSDAGLILMELLTRST